MNDNHQSHRDVSDSVLNQAIRAAATQPLPAELAEMKDRLLEKAIALKQCEQGSPDSSSIGAAKPQEGHWGRIMRHPATRYSAAAVFLIAIGGVALWFHSGGTSPAFADFIKPILNARSVKFKTTMEHGSTTTKADVMVLEPYRMREEQLDANGIKLIAIQDSDTGKILLLLPAQKRAIVSYVANPKENIPQNFFTTFRAQLRDAQDDSSFERTPLGEKEIDGRRVIGYRLRGYAMVIDLWGDPQTGHPIRAEGRAQSWPNIGWIASDFEFNVDLDESLFSTEPPAGYSVEKMGDAPVLPKVEPRAGRKVEPQQ